MWWELIFEIPFGICRAMSSSLLTVYLSPAFGAILQGSLFGLAGLLPASYTAPIMSGQGFAGTFAAFSMICALTSAYLFICFYNLGCYAELRACVALMTSRLF